MDYTIRKHPKLPALIATWGENFVFSRDAPAYAKDMHNHLEQETSPVFYVLDATQWHDMPFEELVNGAQIATRGKDPNFHHPMNRGSLLITSDPAVKVSVEGLRSDAFGNANTMVFNKLEDALAHIMDEV